MSDAVKIGSYTTNVTLGQIKLDEETVVSTKIIIKHDVFQENKIISYLLYTHLYIPLNHINFVVDELASPDTGGFHVTVDRRYYYIEPFKEVERDNIVVIGNQPYARLRLIGIYFERLDRLTGYKDKINEEIIKKVSKVYRSNMGKMIVPPQKLVLENNETMYAFVMREKMDPKDSANIFYYIPCEDSKGSLSKPWNSVRVALASTGISSSIYDIKTLSNGKTYYVLIVRKQIEHTLDNKMASQQFEREIEGNLKIAEEEYKRTAEEMQKECEKRSLVNIKIGSKTLSANVSKTMSYDEINKKWSATCNIVIPSVMVANNSSDPQKYNALHNFIKVATDVCEHYNWRYAFPQDLAQSYTCNFCRSVEDLDTIDEAERLIDNDTVAFLDALSNALNKNIEEER